MGRIILMAVISILMAFPVSARILHVPGQYSTIQSGINASVNGDTVLVSQGTYITNINYSGKSIALLSESGPEATIIQAVNGSGISTVTISGGATGTELAGFTIKNGNTSDPGGGIKISGSSVSIHGNIIKQNHGISGGAVSIVGGNHVRLYDNIIANNSADAMGGGIYCSSGSGNDIYGNVIKNNHTGISGGGIFIEYGSGNNVHHNLIVFNRADVRGGGVLFKDSGHLDNNTIAYDSSVSSTGGGIAFEEQNAHARNNIICNNTGYGVYGYGVSPSLTYNDCWNNAHGQYYGATPGTGSISLDPQFAGGAPFDFHLMGTSPCIDAGDPAAPLDPDGSIADIGAYYYNHVVQGLTLKIGDVYTSPGHQANVPIIVSGFYQHAIAGLELHIEFDNPCLEYSGMQSEFLHEPNVNVVDGEFHLVWDNITNPLNLPDSTMLISLQFVANGELDSTCAVSWMDGNQIVNPDGIPYDDIDFISGGVTFSDLHQICGHLVYYQNSQAIGGVNISLTGNAIRNTQTGENGVFCFNELVSGGYIVCSSLIRNDPGVNITDIIKIRRHIVYLEPFDTPYKLIASDVDTSGTITVADVVLLRRYLANIAQLPGGNWAFVDSSVEINDNNWTEVLNCTETNIGDEDVNNLGFIGVRRGDVNCSWPDENLILNAESDTVALNLNSVSGQVGDTVNMNMLCRGFEDIAGAELHLTYPSGLTFVGIDSPELGEATINGGDGFVHFIWDDIFAPVSIPDGNTVISLAFRIEANALEYQTIAFSESYLDDYTGIEYTLTLGDGQIHCQPTGINDNPTLPEVLILSQNYPNPFNATTTIGYGIPSASNVEVGIYDLLGHRIAILVNEFQEAGYYKVTWNAGSVPSGIYFYQLKSDTYTETKKMSLLK